MKHNNESSKVITVTFDKNDYQFNTELAKPINILYNEICSYFKINPNQYTFYYNNKILLTDNNSQQIYNIINNNQNPIFKIMPKKITVLQKLNVNNPLANSRDKYKSITTRKKYSSNLLTISMPEKNMNSIEINKTKKIYPSVIISQIPSVKDIEEILSNFNKKQNNFNHKTNNNFGYNDGILTFLGNNTVRVEFNEESTLNEFISYISFIKYENNYYKNIIIKKDNSSFKNNTSIRNISHSNKNVRSNVHKFSKKYNYSNSNKMILSENNININDVIKALKQNELNNDCYHGLSLSRDGEDEIVTDYYRQQNYLRNSSPYISENEKRILEEKENKKHFFRHKNFVTSVGKYSMKPNFIPNYVGMTPSENPKNHEFRNVNKNKWITNKGFNAF